MEYSLSGWTETLTYSSMTSNSSAGRSLMDTISQKVHGTASSAMVVLIFVMCSILEVDYTLLFNLLEQLGDTKYSFCQATPQSQSSRSIQTLD